MGTKALQVRGYNSFRSLVNGVGTSVRSTAGVTPRVLVVVLRKGGEWRCKQRSVDCSLLFGPAAQVLLPFCWVLMPVTPINYPNHVWCNGVASREVEANANIVARSDVANRVLEAAASAH